MTPITKQFARKLLTMPEPLWKPAASLSSLHDRINRGLLFLITALITFSACKKDDEIKPNPEPQAKVTASAGTDQVVKAGQVVNLDGSASKDSKGAALTYSWVFTKKPTGSNAALSKASEAKPSFSVDAAGEYEFELTVASTNGQAKDKVLITATPPDLITLSGEITTDRVLENINPDPTKADYLVTDNLVLKAKLTVKPGVIIEFEQDKGLQVYPQGALVAKGTMAERIVFTGKNKTAGYWKGILFESNNPLNELEYASVVYGGSSSYAQLQSDTKANVALAGTAISASALKVANTNFAFSGGYGLFVQGMSEINDFSANVFSKNTGSAIYLPARQVHKLDAASFFSGNNGINGVEISGTLNLPSEVTWPDLTDASSYYISSDITIQSGLKIAEGATLEFREGLILRVEGAGYLNAVGTTANKITFTAQSKTGNLNWGGIALATTSEQNKLQHVEVSYAGNKDIPGYNSLKANIWVSNSGKVSVQQSSVTHGLGWGIVAFTDLGAGINSDAATVNNFYNLPKGAVKLTSTDPPVPTLAGEWLDYWSFSRGYTLDDKYYDRQANRWFKGAADPWSMNPQAGFGLKILENGNYIWTIAEHGPQAGCGNSYSAEYITGTVTAVNNTLSFQENYWRSKFYNPCDNSQSADIDVQPGSMTLRYEINRMYNMLTGEGYWELKIFNPDNTFFKYYKP